MSERDRLIDDNGSVQREYMVETSPIWNPQSIVFRAIMLFGICFLTFGSYYVYDIPSALQSNIVERLDMTKFEYSLLYSVYSWPNVALAFFGGILIDRIGIRTGAILFCSLVLVGQVVVAIGIQMGNKWVAVAGRAIFGLGGECLSVSQSTYTAKWFTGRELALAFGIALSFSRVGSAINFNLSPVLVSHFGLTMAIWIATGICLVSMVMAFLLAIWDYRGDRHRKLTGTMPPHSEEKISIKDVAGFPASLWLLVVICVAFYIAIFVFIQWGQGFFATRFGLDEKHADSMMSIPSIFSAVASPFLGGAVDKIGMSLTWVLIATTGMCLVHLYFNWVPVGSLKGHLGLPTGGMIAMGASYSVCAAALWPCVALVMPSNQLGTAYGLMTAVQNLGLSVAPLAVGAVLGATHSNYTYMEYIFAGCAATAAGATILLIFVDIWKNNRKLNCSASKLKKMLMEESEETKPLIINNEPQYAVQE